jgi:ABC-type phosphate transport system substrate-binding protein
MFTTKRTILSLATTAILTAALLIPLAVSASPYTTTGYPGPTGYARTTHTGAQAGYIPTVWTNPSRNLEVSGSTTIYPIVHAAVTSSAFAVAYPSIVAEVEQLASGQGRDDLGTGNCDLAMSSSAFPTTGELGTQTDGTTQMFDVTKIARDGVIVLINNTVTGITHLSKAQLKGIYQGAYIQTGATTQYWDAPATTVSGTTYPALGGNHIAIKLIARIIGSGTRQSFLDQIGAAKTTLADGDHFTLEETAVSAMGARYNENPDVQAAIIKNDGSADGGIAYVGMGFEANPDGSALANVSIMSIDNTATPVVPIAPTKSTIYDRSYPLARSLQVGVLHGYTTPGSANAQSLINFLLTDDGQNNVSAAGFLKLYMDQDVNKSLSVTVSDVAVVGSHWGETGAPRWIRADVNGSGTITVSDVASIGSWWGFTYAAP